MRRTFGVLTVAGSLVVAAQFGRLPRTNPAVQGDLVAPDDVKGVLRGACYDCHSNETRWPWYSAIAPVSWLIHRDVTQGRQRLNFSEWGAYASDPGTAAQKLGDIATSVERGDMTPWYYRMLHSEARLNTAQRDHLIQWARTAAIRPPGN